MHLDTIIVLLFVVTAAVAIAARRFRVPYTVALVLGGLALGALHALEPPHLTKALLFSVFLPGLIFEAAFHLDLTDFKRNRVTILSLAIPGVLAAIILTALILVPAVRLVDPDGGFGWRYALVFGALIAATDPISVVSLFRSLGAPRRLATLVEGESLLNDGTSIVFFTLAVGVATGAAVSVNAVVLEFLRVVGIGAVVGFLVGITVTKVTQKVDDPMIEITLTTIAAYGSFIGAENIHGSGVIATVVAGMLCGNYGARTGMSPSTRVAVVSFWEYVAFALNSLVFLLVGFEVKLGDLLGAWQVILAAFVAVLVSRAAVVFGVAGLLSRSDERLEPAWRTVLTWGGLKGSLSMVLALSLPGDFPFRSLLVSTTFGVVILSILTQGLSMAPVLRRLGLVRTEEARMRYEFVRGQLMVAQAASREIDQLGKGITDRKLLEPLQEEYQERIAAAEQRLRDMHMEKAELRGAEIRRARRHLLIVEKDQIIESYHEGMLGRDAYEQLLSEVDDRLLRLAEDQGHG